MMEKRILEYRKNSHIKVMAVALRREEQKKVRNELEAIGFEFESIEPDMVVACLYATDDTSDEDLIKTIKTLEENGWRW